jgi:hypothetical protein
MVPSHPPLVDACGIAGRRPRELTHRAAERTSSGHPSQPSRPEGPDEDCNRSFRREYRTYKNPSDWILQVVNKEINIDDQKIDHQYDSIQHAHLESPLLRDIFLTLET